MDSGRRPDRVGVAFGVFVILAAVAVLVRVALPGGDGAEQGGVLRRLLPAFAGGAADSPEEEPPGIGLGAPGRRVAGPLSPLWYDGPRELVPPGPREPDEILVPRIGVRSKLLRLDKRPDGRMEVPGDFGLAGWYVRGPVPGARGPAVIAGHLDSRRGPAVFARLGELEAGDPIVVRRGDGRELRFTVTRVGRYDKAQFPTGEVYGNTAEPELRLITCDGDFDRGRHTYQKNLVVFAAADAPPDDVESFAPVPSNSATPAPTPAGSAQPTASATPEPTPAPTPTPTPTPSPSPKPSSSSTATPKPTSIGLP
jgi:hypothetical protein